MRDYGHEETEKLLAQMERKIAREYRQAIKDTQEKLDDYLRRFKIKDEAWQKMVANGEKTQREYQQWRTGQIMIGKRWEEMRDSLAADLHNSNVIARSIIDGYMPEVYALNHNYATFLVEKGSGVDTSYTLYDRDTVTRLMRDDPVLLPPPGRNMQARIAAGKDIAWQEGQIQSVTLQSILQGESIPNMAKRIANTMGESNHKSTIRYARTATTGAENAGRLDGYKRASDLGIKMRQTWVATLDNRTRHEHRYLDGRTVDVDEPFKVDGYEIRFPGDPQAPGYLIWNCRCTTIAQIKGFERDVSNPDLRRDEKLEGMSYAEWKEGHGVSQPITKQEEIGNAMKWSYINEYRNADRQKSVDISEDSSKIRYRSIERDRKGRPVAETEKTLDLALDREQYIKATVEKYGINLRSGGKEITITVDDTIPQYGKVKKANPSEIVLGLSAFESEEQLAATIAHELNHSRSYLQGGDAPEDTALAAEETILALIRGER